MILSQLYTKQHYRRKGHCSPCNRRLYPLKTVSTYPFAQRACRVDGRCVWMRAAFLHAKLKRYECSLCAALYVYVWVRTKQMQKKRIEWNVEEQQKKKATT